MLYIEALYFESLPLKKKVSFIFESINITDLSNTNSTEISKLEQEFKKEKYKEYFNKLKVPEELKETFDFIKFDFYIAKTFGFGITSLIGPVLNFLNTFKIEFKMEEAVLLIFGILNSIINKENLNEITKDKKINNKNILSLLKYFSILGVNKLLEFIGYTALSIPIASNILSSIKGENINWKQIVLGTTLSFASHGFRSLLNKAKNKIKK